MKLAYAPQSASDLSSDARLANGCGFEFLEILPTDLVDADLTLQVAAISCPPDLDQLSRHITVAADLKCPFLIVPGTNLFSRDGTATSRSVNQLLKAGDDFAHSGGTVLVENQPSTGSASRLWHLLDRLNHPSIACCWNTLFAAQAGDEPAVAVPMLNSRIRYVRLIDGTRTGRAVIPQSIGEGNLPMKKTLDRLRGIGFEGFVSVSTSRLQSDERIALAAARVAIAQILNDVALLEGFGRA